MEYIINQTLAAPDQQIIQQLIGDCDDADDDDSGVDVFESILPEFPLT